MFSRRFLFYFIFLIAGTGDLYAGDEIPQKPPYATIDEEQFSHWLEVKKEKQATLDELIAAAGGDQSSYLNSLVLENSPYLLRHASNPINWQPWNTSVLNSAKEKGKLVFLSIGYSTCHWCHVMEKQSFVNEEVATLLNQHYVSVKVDREQLPDIDAYYSNALEAVVGSSGWPVSVVLDPQGNILFIHSYLDQPKLLKLLARFASLWQKNPSALKSNAALIAQLINVKSSPEVQTEWNDALLHETEKTLLGLLDRQTGGFAGEHKFPAEASLFFMLNQIEKSATTDTPALSEAFQQQLKAMALGGLYDHIHGGFHRYSTDSQWQVPHYEKMLYNQAQLMIVYSRAYRLFGDPLYRFIVKDIADFLRNWMYEAGAGFYSAIDADYQGHEGLYYLWSQDELGRLLAPTNNALKTYSFEQADLLGVILGEPESEASLLVRNKLRQARVDNSRPHIDKKIITAWNAQMVWALAEAYTATGDEAYRQWAEENIELLWSNHFNSADGRLIRNRYLAEAAAQGRLDDYAYLATALVKVYDINSDKLWLERAEYLVKVAVDLFMDEDGGFYFSAKTDEAESHVVRVKTQRDGELLPAGAVLAEVLRELYKRTGDNQYRDLMKQAETFLKKRFIAAGIDNLYAGAVLSDNISGSTMPLQYFAKGKGRVSMSAKAGSCAAKNNIRLDIHLDTGWHVNSSQPLMAMLKPTKVDIEGTARLIKVAYPEGVKKTLGFQQQPLSLYEGDFSITLELLQNSPIDRAVAAVKLQACSDKVCLLPETVRISLPGLPSIC